MNKVFAGILLISLISCGRSHEEMVKTAKEIGEKYGNEYCECLEADRATGGIGIECHSDAMLNMSKELDAEELDDEAFAEGEKVFELLRDECNAESGLGM